MLKQGAWARISVQEMFVFINMYYNQRKYGKTKIEEKTSPIVPPLKWF